VVENGTQINGLAARTGDRLQAAGYTIVEVTSADRFDYAQSQIISYRNDTTAAAAVARTLGLPASTIITSTINTGLDLKVILGNDYQDTAVTPTP
jgi:hypothetical protein